MGCAVKTGVIYASSSRKHFFGGDAGLAHAAQGAAQRTALRCGLCVDLQRQAAALAVVGFGQVDELEVEGKGARQQVGGGNIEAAYALQRLLHGRHAAVVAAADGGAAQFLDSLEKIIARLLAQHLAQQHAERTHIAPQRHLLARGGAVFQLRQPFGPVVCLPQLRHG